MSINLIKVDACGKSCPEPVLLAKKALDQNPPGLEITVDNTTARGNVERFLRNSGCKINTIEGSNEEFIITASR